MASFGFTYEDQSKILEDALQVVKVQTYQMRRCLESNKLMDGLKHCSTMLAELRTSALTPKNYYELYMSIFDSMRHMTDFLKDAHLTERHHLADLYELVQYAGNIIPRLYLMITVGSVYMAMADAPVREIMRDMLEMSRGVQHPTRGLFLRYYLGQMTKDYLPTATGAASNPNLHDVDGPSATDDPRGTLRDAVQFTLTNFIEMNKLWVRLQHQGHSRDREKREMERRELRTLVGSNFIRLSRLEGVDLALYQELILPKVLEQVVNCRDMIAQEYLMEAAIQVFEDDFHLRTLTPLLTACAQLNPKVSVKNIVIALLDRIAAYAARAADDEAAHQRDLADRVEASLELEDSSATASTTVRGIPQDVQLFEVFWREIVALINARPDIAMEDVTALCLSLVKLTLNCYPEEYGDVDQVLDFLAEKAEQAKLSPGLHAPSTINNLLALMQEPVRAYPSALALLELRHYGELLELLTFSTRRAVARLIVEKILQEETWIRSRRDAAGILGYCQVLIKSPKSGGGSGRSAAGAAGVASPRFGDRRSTSNHRIPPSSGLLDDEDYAEDQGLLARLVHLFAVEDPDEQFQLLVDTQKLFLAGGDFVRYTFPPLVVRALQLLRILAAGEARGEAWERTSSQVFKFIHQLVVTLNERVEQTGGCETALRLFLLAGQSADEYGFEEVAYEFFVQAFTVYEENISESRAQFQALSLIVGALYATRMFSEDNYDTLVRKCILHSNKLLKRPDQCRALAMSSHLFWRVPMTADDPAHVREEALFRNGQRVLETLQRAMKVADACLDSVTNVELLVEILDQYVYYYECQTDHIQANFLTGLIHIIHTNINNVEAFASAGPGGASQTTSTHAASSSTIYPRQGPLTEHIVQYFHRILNHLDTRKRSAGRRADPRRGFASDLDSAASQGPTATADGISRDEDDRSDADEMSGTGPGFEEANPFASPGFRSGSPSRGGLDDTNDLSGFPDYSEIDTSAGM
ncbi:retromer complex subunit Vps35 [Tieghemiomyces parasiticus]|uniref:Vacuolar protein sorting-associated protein 35 n=1 Tax=Tieghemiomyces parasiticus TaxID=78921 RepID=A0A9W8E1F6_9FUNG|nr:retromer complex subunit Vps35 [Tieghemiomyces parasiticus]